MHINSKGVMATNEQGGSMLNNRSYPQNTRWIYVSAKCHIKCNKVLHNLGNSKMTMLLSAQGLQSKLPKKGTNPNHANKEAEVEHGGYHLITGQ